MQEAICGGTRKIKTIARLYDTNLRKLFYSLFQIEDHRQYLPFF